MKSMSANTNTKTKDEAETDKSYPFGLSDVRIAPEASPSTNIITVSS
jgi:hypothetical protein